MVGHTGTPVSGPKIRITTCQGRSAAKTAFSGAPVQNTRIPEYHISQNGILDFSPKNAAAGVDRLLLNHRELLSHHRVTEHAEEDRARAGGARL
jgi:hypothetical protein